MKKIRYKIRLQNDKGTETIHPLSIESPEEKLEENLAVIKSQDYVGDIIIEDIPDEPQEPTQFDRVEAQVAYTAMMTDTLLEV